MRAAFLLLVAGCGALDFDVSQPIPQERIPGDPVAAAAGSLLASAFPSAFNFNIDLKAQQSAHDTGPIDSVHLKSLALAIDASSPTQNFDWLDEAHIFVEATGLQKREVAHIMPVPKGQKTISFTVDGSIDLKPYIDKGVNVTTSATAHASAQDVVFGGTAVFRVSPI
jgi:hypothetical protein